MKVDLEQAHKHSSNNRVEISQSDLCGCFHCCSIFESLKIYEWIDEDKDGVGQTALCPECDVDAVIGDRSGYKIDKVFLQGMFERWFK